jgi:hypothetical protein
MLWRTSYATTLLDASDFSCPTGFLLTGDVWQPEGAFCIALALTEEGIRNLGVWRRLFDSVPTILGYLGYVRTGLADETWSQIPDLTPPSAWQRTILIEHLPDCLQALVVDSKVIGFVCDGASILHAVSGPPTEDAWEEFCSMTIIS